MNQRPKRIVISSGYGTPNIGDTIISLSLIDAIKLKYPDAEITYLSLKKHNVEKYYDHVNTIKSGIIIGLISTIQAICKADLLVVGGGGIIQDASSFGNLVFHLSRPLIAVTTGTPFIAVGIGVGPLKHRASRYLTFLILERAKHISVRDITSQILLKSIGISEKKVGLTSDLAWLFNSHPENHQRLAPEEKSDIHPQLTGKLRIGISLRPEIGRHKQPNKHTIQYGILLDEISKLIRYLTDSGHQVFFISMNYEQDDFIGHILYSQNHSIFLLSGNNHPRFIEENISNLDIMIGMRLHALILASRNLIPVIGIAYDQKVVELLQQLDQSSNLIDIADIKSSRIIGMIEEIQNHYVDNKNRLEISVTKEKINAEINIVILQSQLANS